MARPRKVTSFNSAQAQFILERAIADRKLSSADVNRYLGVMHEEIWILERRLAKLRNAVVEPVKRVVQEVRATVKTRRRKARRKALSAERVASMKLQGEYLRYLRQTPERNRNRFKQIAKDLGREKAIAAMKKDLGK